MKMQSRPRWVPRRRQRVKLFSVIVLAFVALRCVLWVPEKYRVHLAHGIRVKVPLDCDPEKPVLQSGIKENQQNRATHIADTLVLYSYYQSYHRRQNAQFFIDNGYVPNTDFIFIDSGCSADFSELQLDTTKMPWWRVYRRRNFGYDFCAWTDLLQHLKHQNMEKFAGYKYFVLMNASVRGPYLPAWMLSKSNAKGTNWKEVFVNQISEETKLVGTTINCFFAHPNDISQLHLQSMFLVLDLSGMDLYNNVVTQCVEDKQDVIDQYEIGLSQSFLENGYNIASQQLYWLDHDFRDFNSTVSKCKRMVHGDPTQILRKEYDVNFKKGYFDTTINPMESIFFKSGETKRNFSFKILNLYSDWINEARSSS